LRLANPSPSSGWIEDFHLQAVVHTRHTTRGRLCSKKAQASATKSTPQQPAFPAQWFYGLYVISSVTMLGCHRRSSDSLRPATLAPASERQDHTTSPSAGCIIRPRKELRLILPRPSHPKPNVRDDRETPLLWTGTAETVSLIWGNREAKYFRCDDWTGFRVRWLFCLSGKSICRFDNAKVASPLRCRRRSKWFRTDKF
jgi:hypothetical protein